MSTSEDTCPETENSTDCLLRAVLDAVNSHNDSLDWSPLNFAFTLVIGLVALLFAAMAIIQGGVAESRGLRKCSRNAIGPWSGITKRHWNLSELRRDCVAFTPVLTRNVLLSRLESGSDMLKKTRGYLLRSDFSERLAGRTADTTFSHTLPYAAPDRQIDVRPSEKYYAATWLQFLTSLELGEFIWEHFQGNTKATLADYLPSEIQAVPAFASIGSIIVLAAVAGCDELAISPESGYPLMSGPNLQVHFRRDPFLGTVVTFERYDLDPITAGSVPLAYSLKSAILNSRGDFQTRCGRTTKVEKQDSFINVVENVSEVFKLDSPEAPHITGPGLRIDRNKCLELHPDVEQLCHSWDLLLNIASRHNFAWLLYADPPESPPVIFPASLAAVTELIDVITLLGTFWSRIRSTDPRIRRLLHVSDWRSFWSAAGRDRSRADWEAFALCLHFAEDVSSGGRIFKSLTRDMRLRFGLRWGLIRQMQAIDSMLPDGVDCELAQLYMMTAAIRDLSPLREIEQRIGIPVRQTALLDSQTMLEPPARGGRVTSPAMNVMEDLVQFFNFTGFEPGEGLYGFRFKSRGLRELDQLPNQVVMLLTGGASLRTPLGNQARNLISSLYKLVRTFEPENIDLDTDIHIDMSIPGPIELLQRQEDSIRQLLIYRAILLGVLCLTAIDNSEFFDDGIACQIIRVL
ncbi:hypothetical protein BKA64DRAFT_671972 [Cadophora sp. MPI-SDFR-AT-0126]|nr:hypothetical protein BKA64DRAFT_671972 [Leotiomycetes sp. MPI-SDFR-AT-0126]